MEAEDRVLVGVVNRKRDLTHLLTTRSYRIPQVRMPDGVSAEALAFFLSRSAHPAMSGIYHYALLRGIELHRRRDIMPQEPQHRRADDLYWLCQLDTIRENRPPILNPGGRAISFIHTTWDRFADALTIQDLYQRAPYYVSRVYYALPRRVTI